MTKQEINELIDSAALQVGLGSAEKLNALHACRPGHPLGQSSSNNWENALLACGHLLDGITRTQFERMVRIERHPPPTHPNK